MERERMVKVSKFLSKHLRHQPERLGLTLQEGGWVAVEELLTACAAQRFPVSRAELDEVVASNEKQRFAFDESRQRIRANQGHSVEVDLQLEPAAPPALLYHGTPDINLESVQTNGLLRMRRHHVHLSADRATAITVGNRHGKAVLLAIDAAAMHADGFAFYRSANGVWLVDTVPPRYLSVSP